MLSDYLAILNLRGSYKVCGFCFVVFFLYLGWEDQLIKAELGMDKKKKHVLIL